MPFGLSSLASAGYSEKTPSRISRRSAVPRNLCSPRCGFGARGNEIGDGLGLHQVQLVVQEGALGEFTRAGGAGAQSRQATGQQLLYHGPTMTLQFDNIFTGERGGAGKKQGDAGIHHTAFGVVKSAKVGVARLKAAPGDLLSDGVGLWP